MSEMQIREYDTDHEQGAQNRVSGPDWRWFVGLGGTIIVILVGLVSSLSAAQLAEVKSRQESHSMKIEQHNTDITRLQSDMSYIKQGVDEIRQMMREDF